MAAPILSSVSSPQAMPRRVQITTHIEAPEYAIMARCFFGMGVARPNGSACVTWKTKAWQRHFPYRVLASRKLRCCTGRRKVFGDTMSEAGVACTAA
jgi:hypothetical protein